MVKEAAVYRGRKLTIADALALHPMPDYLPFVCAIKTETESYYVLRSDGWDTYEIPEGALCMFVAYASGGGGGKKNPLATILMLLVVAAVTWGAGAALGTVGVAATAAGAPAVAGTGLAGILGSVGGAQAIIGIGSSLILAGASYLINMALPPSFPKPEAAPDPVYSITSRSNQARIGAPQEVRYGRLKVYPSLCAAPYAEFTDSFANGAFGDQVAGDQTLQQIFMMTWGYYDLEEVDIVNQSLESLSEAAVQKFEPGEQITSFPSSVYTVPAVDEIYLEFPLGNREAAGIANIVRLFNGSVTVNAQQLLTVENYEAGSSLNLRLDGVATTDLVIPFTAQDVEDAVEDLYNVGSGNVRCTGGPILPPGGAIASSPIVIEFIRKKAFMPISQMTIDRDDLTEDGNQYPNWGSILYGGFDKITASGRTGSGSSRQGWIEVSDYLGIDNSLVGKLLAFRLKPEQYIDTPQPYAGSVVVSIASNTGNQIYWNVPSATELSTLLDQLGRAMIPETDTGPFNYYEVLDVKNWRGPFTINPDESTDLINEIGIDIVLPEGLSHEITSGTDPFYAGWRVECQQLDDEGEPISGSDTPWFPLTTSTRYHDISAAKEPYASGPLLVQPAGNLTIYAKAINPIRFTIRAEVPEGRYQVRVANVYGLNSALSNVVPGINNPDFPFEIPPGYAANDLYSRAKMGDIESGRGTHARSYWTGLRGYSTREVMSWEDRTILTVRITATDTVNGNTLKQFGVTGTRKLQDYVGAIDDGTLPTNPFTTKVFTNAQISGPLDDPTVPPTLRTSRISADDIGYEFAKNDYVRLSGFTDPINEGEFLVLSSSDNSLEVLGDLVTALPDVANVAGSRRIRSMAPRVVSSVEIGEDSGSSTIEATGIGLHSEFAVGNRVTLSGFVDATNNVKCTIASRTDDMLVVEETLTIEAASADTKAHSAPPYGLVGELLDGLPAVFSGASAVGGISAASLNSTVFDDVSVVITGRVTTLEATGIGLEAWAVAGNLVTLTGFTEKRNQETVYISAVEDDALTVTIPPSTSRYQPIPTRSSLVAESGAPGKAVVYGARKILRTGDTTFEFFADQGATSEVSGGGTVTYSFPNAWTGLQKSRRISSAAYDLATDPNYGGGVDPSRVDLEGLRQRETTWDSRDRYETDGITWKEDPAKDYYDYSLNERKLIHEIFAEMARCGRARPMYPSGILTFIRDEPRPVADDSYQSNNMKSGSLEFVATFPTDDTPDHVLAQFFNKEFWDFDEVIATFKPYSLGQEIDIRNATGGSYTLTYDGHTTAAIPKGTSPSAVQDAIELLPNVVADTLVFSGTANRLVVTYAEALLGTNVPLIVGDETGLVGPYAAVYVRYTINPEWPGNAPARLSMPGVTDRKHAWREAIYELGSANQRRMMVKFGTDVEGYIPSYLSRIDVNDEVLSRGQHGLVLDYVVAEDELTSSIFTSVPLDWSQAGSYVIQLRDQMGRPVTDGLFSVTEGALPNEAVMESFFEEAVIGLHTEHKVGREATYFSFGLVNNHNLRLLVTGIRPTSNEDVSIEGYIYKEEGVYDVDGDYDYTPLDEAAFLDARQIGDEVRDLKALLSRNYETGETQIRASWAPASWSSRYLVETSRDGFNWSKVLTTLNAHATFPADALFFVEEVVAEDYVCGATIDPGLGSTYLQRSGGTAWTAGQFNGMTLAFKTGAQAGARYLITGTASSYLTIEATLSPQPATGVDTYDIVTTSAGELLVGVRGYNGVYGPRATVTATGDPGIQMPVTKVVEGGGITVTLPEGGGESYTSVVETYRRDYYGNLFISGKMFDGDHITRHLYVGTQPQYDGGDASVAYLPSEPRDGKLLLFLQDSLLTKVSAAPGEAEYTVTGTTIQLGFDRNTSLERLHFIMVSADDDSESLAGIRIGEACTFTPATSTATLPFTPARPEEVLLYLNGDVLFPVPGAPAAGQFSLSGTTITTHAVLGASDVLLCLGLADDRTTEADRFHCIAFTASMLPMLPLFPQQIAIAQGGTMRWQDTGFGNFRFADTPDPKLTLLWGAPDPTDEETKYAIMMRAKA